MSINNDIIAKPILIVPIDNGSRYLNLSDLSIQSNQPNSYSNPATFIIDREIFSSTDKLQLYNHIGEYIIESSSYEINYEPEHAFNYGDKGWKSNNSIIGSSNTITTVTQNPDTKKYSSTSITNSTNYSNPHFGGSFFNKTNPNTNSSNKDLTNTNIKIDNSISRSIKGEWLQIQLPEPIYLFSYTIKVDPPKLVKNDNLKHLMDSYNVIPPSIPNYSSFYSNTNGSDYYISYLPKVFTIVGSNDGNKWYYIDHQSFITPPDLINSYTKQNLDSVTSKNLINGYTVVTNEGSSQLKCQINSIDHYTYFRIIITEMFSGNKQVQINEFDLYAFVDIITPNSSSLKRSIFNDISLNDYGSIESFVPERNSQEYLTGMQSWDYLTNDVDNKLINLYREQLTTIKDAKNQNTLPNLEGFDLKTIEGYDVGSNNMDSYGYIKYNQGVNGNAIIQNQITPLNRIHIDFMNLQNKVNQNYVDLSNNIPFFTNNFNNLSTDQTDHYEMNTNNFNKAPTKEDGWINDNKLIVLEQNSIYILSTITVATLIIAIIFASK